MQSCKSLLMVYFLFLFDILLHLAGLIPFELLDYQFNENNRKWLSKVSLGVMATSSKIIVSKITLIVNVLPSIIYRLSVLWE